MGEAIFTGVLSRSAVADVFASADLFVFPSQTDTAGNVVLEAQASGLPVVVSSGGGAREQMVADQTGLICDSDAADAWATAVSAIVSQPSRHRAMRDDARTYAMSRRWEQALQPLYDAYRETATIPNAGNASPVLRQAVSRA
jgi:glycosyltransferase involved in cell wall biosynthesis